MFSVRFIAAVSLEVPPDVIVKRNTLAKGNSSLGEAKERIEVFVNSDYSLQGGQTMAYARENYNITLVAATFMSIVRNKNSNL